MSHPARGIGSAGESHMVDGRTELAATVSLGRNLVLHRRSVEKVRCRFPPLRQISHAFFWSGRFAWQVAVHAFPIRRACRADTTDSWSKGS